MRSIHQPFYRIPFKEKIAALASRGRDFSVLALECSADDTCAAVVTSDRRILSTVVLKGHERHEQFGGIQPLQAAKFHQQHMPDVIQQALKEARLTLNEVDGIAFTRGPGMGSCLLTCSVAARTLAASANKPFVGVHHMQAHALTPLLTTPTPPEFPFLTLLVSGGHTLLLVAHSPTEFETLATTADSSIGNAIDRIARLLSIPWTSPNSSSSAGQQYIGPGAALELLAQQEPPFSSPLPQVAPFSQAFPRQLKFSYAGPVSHAQRFIESQTPGRLANDIGLRIAIARRFQEAVFGQLEEKVRLALDLLEKRGGIRVKSLVVSGGVASNSYLRERLRVCLDEYATTGKTQSEDVSLVFPPPHLCTDNAVMIGWASVYRFMKGDHDDHSADIKSIWPIEELSSSNRP